MAGRMHGGLIAACGNADAVEHEHEHEQRDAVPETVGCHEVGWGEWGEWAEASSPGRSKAVTGRVNHELVVPLEVFDLY